MVDTLHASWYKGSEIHFWSFFFYRLVRGELSVLDRWLDHNSVDSVCYIPLTILMIR
jgi:hypothetical protein